MGGETMKEKLDVVISIMTIILMMLQGALLSYLMYTTHKRFEEDKKSWEEGDDTDSNKE